MGNSKKELITQFHRENIMKSAKQLFEIKGISTTTVDDIAKAAGISKSTMYVYYKRKEEIIEDIQLEQMILINSMLVKCAQYEQGEVYYFTICQEMVKLHEQSPICFSLLFEEIDINDEELSNNETLQKLYEVGESNNELIASVLTKNIKAGIVKPQLNVIATVFYLWSGISKIIEFAEKKQQYIKRRIGMEKQEYRNYAFQLLWNSILVEDKI